MPIFERLELEKIRNLNLPDMDACGLHHPKVAKYLFI